MGAPRHARRLEFRILGPFEVIDDGNQPLALGGFKQRAVLALLTLSPNRVVSVDRLVDALWEENAPRQATGSLQAYVSNLRRVLEPDRPPREPPRVLCSHEPGYVLVLDAEDLDAQRFERLAAEGRGLLRDGVPDAARRTLGEALDLWRGPALADFRELAFARTEAARLEELRAEALEARVAADLALGEHRAVVAELQRLVADEPLREQLWEHLILALYRSGRQSDALAAYRRCRRTLDEELGIEPNRSLRGLEADILRQAPSLEWTPAGAGAAAGAGARPQEDEGADAPASLAYRDAAGSLQVFPLTPGRRIKVGREASADVWLSWDARVSRLHAELEGDGEQWAVIDDGTSRNGSYLNGQRVRGRCALQDGDQLRFGDTLLTFRFHLDSADAETYLGTMTPDESREGRS